MIPFPEAIMLQVVALHCPSPSLLPPLPHMSEIPDISMLNLSP